MRLFCVRNHSEQHHFDTFTNVYYFFLYAEHMHMKNESNQQKPPINEIYFFFKMKLMGIVRMHLAEIELRCKQIYAKFNSMERMFFFLIRRGKYF